MSGKTTEHWVIRIDGSTLQTNFADYAGACARFHELFGEVEKGQHITLHHVRNETVAEMFA